MKVNCYLEFKYACGMFKQRIRMDGVKRSGMSPRLCSERSETKDQILSPPPFTLRLVENIDKSLNMPVAYLNKGFVLIHLFFIIYFDKSHHCPCSSAGRAFPR